MNKDSPPALTPSPTEATAPEAAVGVSWLLPAAPSFLCPPQPFTANTNRWLECVSVNILNRTSIKGNFHILIEAKKLLHDGKESTA